MRRVALMFVSASTNGNIYALHSIALALGILSMCYGAIPVYTEESVRSTVVVNGTEVMHGTSYCCICDGGQTCVCHYDNRQPEGIYTAVRSLYNDVYQYKCGAPGDYFCLIQN